MSNTNIQEHSHVYDMNKSNKSRIRSYLVRFLVLTEKSMKVTVVWDAAPCSQVDIAWCFGGVYCLHRQDYSSPDDGSCKLFWYVDRCRRTGRYSHYHEVKCQTMNIRRMEPEWFILQNVKSEMLDHQEDSLRGRSGPLWLTLKVIWISYLPAT